MKAQMEKAGLHVERFFSQLEKSVAVGAPRKGVVSIADDTEEGDHRSSAVTTNQPIESTRRTLSNSLGPTSSVAEE